MHACVESEQLAVQHMRQPGYRNKAGMPIANKSGGECPLDARRRQTGLHLGVLGDIQIVIEAGELMGPHLEINNEGRDYQEDTYENMKIPLEKCIRVGIGIGHDLIVTIGPL